MADDLEQLRLLLGIDRPIVIGNSFGGMLALVYATRHPNRAGKLVLISTTPSHEFLNEATAIMEERGTEEQKQTMPTIFAGQVRTQEEYRQWWDVMLPMYFHACDLELGDRMLGRTIGNPEIARYMFEQGIPQYDVRPGLGAITVPTLIMAGRHDWITPPSQNEEIHHLIPGSELHIFEHSGHMPFIEEQEEFLQVMRRFLGLEVPEMAGART
jgi:proline iminopeptidase